MEKIDRQILFYIINSICFLSYLITALIVTVKLNFKIDRSSILTMSIYAVSFLIKEINWTIQIFAPDSFIGWLPWIDIMAS